MPWGYELLAARNSAGVEGARGVGGEGFWMMRLSTGGGTRIGVTTSGLDAKAACNPWM
jgi:hypothetical protein